MIRPARSTDAPVLTELLCERYEESRYVEVGNVDRVIARKLFAQAAQRHGGTNDGAYFLMVSEDPDGDVEVYLLGALTRTYIIGDRLSATDLLLISRKDASPRRVAVAIDKLIEAFVSWADANPKVCEKVLSWSDTIPGTDKIMRVFEKHGFTEFSRSFRADTPFARIERQEMAA